VNVPDAHQGAVVDLKTRKQVSTWKTPGLGSNFPMALADAGQPLAVVFRSPARLALLDPATGAVTTSLETCGDADDVFFDGKRDRIYVSCGDGTVDVVQGSPDGVRRIERVATPGGPERRFLCRNSTGSSSRRGPDGSDQAPPSWCFARLRKPPSG
jgi:hypothetical protein